MDKFKLTVPSELSWKDCKLAYMAAMTLCAGTYDNIGDSGLRGAVQDNMDLLADLKRAYCGIEDSAHDTTNTQ